MSTSATATTPLLQTGERLKRIAAWCLLGVVFLLCYAKTLRGLTSDWWIDPDYSFGLVAPIAVAYIVTSRRESFRNSRLKPSTLSGLAVVVISQVVFVVGKLAADLFLQRSSVVVLAAGIVLYLAGWFWLKPLLLPLLLFELCIPLPGVVLRQISMSLQLISSSAAGEILRMCGVPVFRMGNILQLPNETLNVVEACSGLRSLASMMALALLLISSSRLAWWIRTFFVLSSAVVAIAANAVRISAAGLLAEHFGPLAISGTWHLAEGWLVFILAFLMLGAELAALRHLPWKCCEEGSE